MSTDLEYFAKRNHRYWYIDGINEILTGALFVFLGLLFYIRTLISTDSPLTGIVSTAHNILLTAGIGIGIILIQWLKERSTYPRSGYISYLAISKKRIWRRVAVFIVIFLLVTVTLIFLFLTYPLARSGLIVGILWLPFLLSVALGANWIVLGVRTDLKRFYLIGGISLLMGLGLGYLSLQLSSQVTIPTAAIVSDPYGQMPPEIAPLMNRIFLQISFQAAIYCATIGIIAVISGIITRYVYLRQNPILLEK